SPYTEFGIKGMGEGGAIAPPAVNFNAVNDALRPLGVELTETPLTPRPLLMAIDRAKASTQPRMGSASRPCASIMWVPGPSRRHWLRWRRQKAPGFWQAGSRWGRC